MAIPEAYPSAQFFVGLLYSQIRLRDVALGIIESEIGSLSSRFGPIPFTFTDYYENDMGSPMFREIIAIEPLRSPEGLSTLKLKSNEIELHITEGSGFVRPVNIDPGYIDRYKLVLASCKNGPMRIPLSNGVYAEVTMTWRKDGFQPHDLTYADYRSDEVRTFLSKLRMEYIGKLRRLPKPT